MYKKIYILFIFFICMNPAYSAFTDADLKKLPTIPVTKKIHYGENIYQFGDLRIPKGSGPYPVVIVIHGGCWLAKFTSLEETSPLASSLTNAGFATWNIEYRRVDNRGGGWPGTFLDIGAAVDYVQKIAPKYNLDLNRVIIIGHSAGGHLALWAVARHKLPKSSILYPAKPTTPIRGVINLAGPGNLISFLPLQGCVCDEKIINRMLGGTPEEKPERYHDASPFALLPLGVKQILITGNDDFSISPILGREYQLAAQKANDDVQLFTIKNVGHDELLSPESEAWPVIKQSAWDLIK